MKAAARAAEARLLKAVKTGDDTRVCVLMNDPELAPGWISSHGRELVALAQVLCRMCSELALVLHSKRLCVIYACAGTWSL